MIYNHLVKYNGKYYPAGTDVPVGVNTVENKKVEEVKDDFSQYMNAPETDVTYTKTEINRMPVAQLREMAMRTGVEGADTWSGAELKEYLIAILGL